MNYLKTTMSACGMALLMLASCGGSTGSEQTETAPSSTSQKTSISAEKKFYMADVDQSNVHWLGKKVTGEHEGDLKLVGAKLAMANGLIQEGNFIFNMKSITCTDIESQDYNDKFIDHLRSDDFFSIEKYPTATYDIKASKKANGNSLSVTGDLKIKDKVVMQDVMMEIIEEGTSLVLKGQAVVDRTAFDIRYGSGKFFDNLGDRMIDDDFVLDFNLVMVSH